MLIQIVALLSCLPWSAASGSATTGAVQVVGRVEVPGGVSVALVSIAAEPPLLLAPAPEAGSRTNGTAPEQVLTTTVQDPAHPGEPWVVTTYRRPDESFEAFIKRHREMVEAVRRALGG
jgi:hypothetical protein